MVPASAPLFDLARHVDPARRHLFLVAAWSGALGLLLTFVLFQPVCEEYESTVFSFLGILFAMLTLMFMSLAGFKSR
jgi:hypothetical protein